MECLAACELAPVIQVTEIRNAENDSFVGSLDGEAAGMLIDELRAKAEASPAPAVSAGLVADAPHGLPGVPSGVPMGMPSDRVSDVPSRGASGASSGGAR